MHQDKLGELKKALKTKKEIEEKKAEVAEQTSPGEVLQLQSKNEELTSKVSELEKELELAKSESKEANEKHIRLYAEFENFRKRAQKEKQDLIQFTQEEVLKEFLQILDDLERGLAHTEKSKDLKVLLDGVKLVEKNMLSLFEKFGLTALETVGQPFNPHVHEAMSHQESTEHAPDTVAAEFRKGYLLKGKLVRPALVAVAKSPSDGSDSSTKH